MISHEIKNRLTAFAERIEKFYGQQVTILESISADKMNFDRHVSTFGRYQLNLEHATWRVSGGRMIFSQTDLYYEVSVDNLLDFKEMGNCRLEFLEKYSETVYRKTVLEF